MEELATAVQLMTEYRVRQSVEYVGAVMGRVDELVAAATLSLHQGADDSGKDQQQRPGMELKCGKAPVAGAGVMSSGRSSGRSSGSRKPVRAGVTPRAAVRCGRQPPPPPWPVPQSWTCSHWRPCL